ncbi:biorientation of chromosomes in cell division protein 1-like 1 [Cyprinus carpio]|uniref:Biorientation of chromosomes in cell division protein 1-like 1 n=1 Tax=Cyprinus carpio TaxID=7962 RepID=A0A9Q9YUA0_CYPCA|nr:biorientation of chromosomes in cell division protein 1-like 1 [Cyprinus carpio]
MLEQGVDRIVAQVVDPKVHHSFRPQVERVVRKFLSPNGHVEEDELPPLAPPLPAEYQEAELLTADHANDDAPAGSSGADVQIPETSGTDPSHEHREEEMDISLTEEEQLTAETKEEPEEPQPGEEEEEERDAEMEAETEEVKDEGDAGSSSKSSGKIREENRDTDSQKPSSTLLADCFILMHQN